MQCNYQGSFCGDTGCDVHGIGDQPEPIYGPQLPMARCKCGTLFTWEHERRNGRTVWRCECQGCVDGEYVGDPLTLSVSIRSGEGDSPWEALDDCAAMNWDCFPEELMEVAK